MDFIDFCRKNGVQDLRFSYAGGNLSFCEGYPDDQRMLVEEVAAKYDPDAPPALSDLKEVACSRIEAARRSLEQSGVWINWPDGARSKIQTRDERDWRNINGVAARGLARLMQGLSDEDWFRDADDVNHTLLPTQAVDTGYQAAAAISVIAKIAQDAKDAINADTVTTAEQVAAIEAGVVWP